ncbi:MAG: DegT/DnrJ/EryC1/StrS family aminotransferase [Patescibacteria group bacterium]|nr:DegT/DnrJ/EryC1/StrS family aminotransferase [Patescibacteria group bacterium]
MKKNIYVTQPSLPDLEDFIVYLRQIWESKMLTNNGPFHQQFEKELADFLGVKHISVFTNTTLALMISLRALEIKGEVITTPYTFVATSHALHWNNIKPVFCDIKYADGNIDESKIEALITPETSAIMPVLTYGHPCDFKKISEIAKAHGLKVIYDAAHAFNVKEDGASVLNFGDLAILSFHATKIFNTFEGGAIICHDQKTKERIDYLKNFGFKDEVTVVGPGINAKMNEFQAALGLLQLKKVNSYIEKNKAIHDIYENALKNIKGIGLFAKKQSIDYNYSYYPILVKDDFPLTRDQLYDKLKKNGIYARRYFYPLVTEFKPYNSMVKAKSDLEIAYKVADQILCLPIYPGLASDEVDRIINLIYEEK